MIPPTNLSPDNVLLSLGSWSTGSVERSVLDVAKIIGCRVLLPWVPDAQRSETAKEWYPSDVDWRIVDRRHKLANRGWRRIYGLSRTLRALPEKMVNLHYSTVAGASVSDVLAARLARKRVILTLHSPIENHPISGRIRRRVRRAVSLSDCVVVTSPFAHDFVREIVGDRPNIQVIPLGLDARAQADGWKHRQHLSIPEDDFVISHVARTHRGKGLPMVARAIVRAGLEKQVWLLTGGDGPERGKISAEVNGLLGDRFINQGWLADPDPTYAASNVMAMPSEVEAFGMVYLEAAAQGVASIGFRTGGVPVALADGETGFLAPLGDEEAIARHLRELYENRKLCQKMGQAAKERIHKYFTSERMGADYAALFKEIA